MPNRRPYVRPSSTDLVAWSRELNIEARCLRQDSQRLILRLNEMMCASADLREQIQRDREQWTKVQFSPNGISE